MIRKDLVDKLISMTTDGKIRKFQIQDKDNGIFYTSYSPEVISIVKYKNHNCGIRYDLFREFNNTTDQNVAWNVLYNIKLPNSVQLGCFSSSHQLKYTQKFDFVAEFGYWPLEGFVDDECIMEETDDE
jgi:hypothetical protein